MKQFLARNKKTLAALGLAFGVMAAFKLFCALLYETNDDTIMSAISYGYYGSPQAGLVYIHPLLGGIYALLQRMLPWGEWYLLGELGLLGLSMAALYRLALDREDGIPAVGVLTVFYVGALLFRLQYTRIAGTAAAAGILVLFRALRERKGRAWLLLGFVLALGGFCLRSDAFFMVLIPLAGVGVAELLRRVRAGEKRQTAGLVVTFALLFTLCGGLLLRQKLYYGAEWDHYQRYNALRTELMDYGFPDYGENQALYARLNISEADLALFQSWDFGDPEVFNIEAMEALCAAKPPKTVSLGGILACCKGAVQGMLRFDFAAGLLLAVLLWLWTADGKGLALGLYALAAMFGTEAWLQFSGRGLRARVDAPLMLTAAAILLLACSRRENRRLPKGQAGCLLAAALVVSQVPFWLGLKSEAQETWLESDRVQQSYAELSADKDTLYFFREAELPANLLPRRQGGFGYYSNLASLGGWLTDSPYTVARNRAFGVENPFRDCVDAPNIRIVSSDIEPVLAYIRAHYAENARAEAVSYTGGGIPVYAIVSR